MKVTTVILFVSVNIVMCLACNAGQVPAGVSYMIGWLVGMAMETYIVTKALNG